MPELDQDNQISEKPRRFHFEWIFPLFFRPRRALKEIGTQAGAVWIAPMLILSILVLFNGLAAGSVRQTQVQSVSATPPQNAEYYTPEQLQQFQQAQSLSRGPIFIYVFPITLSLVGLWVRWFLLGSIFHIILTLSGSRSPNVSALNIAAWTGLPAGLRDLIQGVYVLMAQRLISSQGLSGFMTAGKGLSAFALALLTLVDIYLIWQILLLMGGARTISGMQRAKAWGAAFTAVVILLVLQALPGFLMAQFSGIAPSGMFYF